MVVSLLYAYRRAADLTKHDVVRCRNLLETEGIEAAQTVLGGWHWALIGFVATEQTVKLAKWSIPSVRALRAQPLVPTE
jgi:hypothetical protein